jgi:hypothetical protein
MGIHFTVPSLNSDIGQFHYRIRGGALLRPLIQQVEQNPTPTEDIRPGILSYNAAGRKLCLLLAHVSRTKHLLPRYFLPNPS